MGKAIVVVFFLLAFVVFTVIKLAAKGVKDAYRSVNDGPSDGSHSRPSQLRLEGPDEEQHNLIEFVASSLSVQKALIADEYEMLPDRARDNWALGYVGGYTDAILQRKGIEADGKGLAMVTIVFMTTFGKEAGPAYVRKFMDLQEAKNPELFDGMRNGGEDVLRWLADTDKVPMGWAAHVHDSA